MVSTKIIALFLFRPITTQFHADGVNADSQSAPFKPPAPLNAGASNDFINLFMRINGNNIIKEYGELHRYELQIRDGEKWKNIQDITPSVGPGYPVSTTVSRLAQNRCYTFRMRAVFDQIISAWSSETETICTKATIPFKPTSVQELSVSATSITLQWDLPSNRSPHLDRLGRVNECFLQYRSDDIIDTEPEYITWLDYNSQISGISDPALIEVQEVQTLVDPTSNITLGSFWLELDIPKGDCTDRFDSSIRSAQIRHNATETEFKSAISKIEGIGRVRVYRYKPNSFGGSVADERGSFAWRVEFFDLSDIHVPLMQYLKDDMDGVYSSSLSRVRVRRLQAGRSAIYKETVSVVVNGLEPYSYYSFRIACENEYGTSEWTTPHKGFRTDYDVSSKVPMEGSKHAVTENDTQWAHLLALSVSYISYDLFKIFWNTHGSETSAYEIEVSSSRTSSGNEGGSCSDDFHVVDRKVVDLLRSPLTSTVTGLYPATRYCVRLIVFTKDRIIKQGNILSIVTNAAPENNWFPTTSLVNINQNNIINNLRCDVPTRPSARRGHSLTSFHDKIYLFGGLGSLCTCTSNSASSCSWKMSFSNDLWAFDVKTRIWTLLHRHTKDEKYPKGREQHSATRISNGKIIYIGGRTSSSLHPDDADDIFLGDVWELDPGQFRSYEFSAVSSGALPRRLVDGQIYYHKMDLSTERDFIYRDDDVCVQDLTINVVIEHTCVEEVKQISMFGPGRQPFSSYFTSNSRDREVMLFRSPRNAVTKCSYQLLNITFSDKAETSIQQHLYLPEKGVFKAAEDIVSHFYRQHANGTWVIAVYDSVINNKTGSLLESRIGIQTKPCTDEVRWNPLSLGKESATRPTCKTSTSLEGIIQQGRCNGEIDSWFDQFEYNDLDESKDVDINLFTSRYRHSALAVGNNIYVVGGRAQISYAQTWRFNYDSKTWTRLKGVDAPSSGWEGQSAVLSPFGIFTFGGIQGRSISSSILDNKVWRFDVVKESWFSSRHVVSQNAPMNRYLSAACYVGLDHHLISYNIEDVVNMQGKENKAEPLILLFGGDMNLPNHVYLGDMWVYTINKEVDEAIRLRYDDDRDKFCENLYGRKFIRNGVEYNAWEWSCGTFGDIYSQQPCSWKDVVKRAWCLGQFQSYYNPM